MKILFFIMYLLWAYPVFAAVVEDVAAIDADGTEKALPVGITETKPVTPSVAEKTVTFTLDRKVYFTDPGVRVLVQLMGSSQSEKWNLLCSATAEGAQVSEKPTLISCLRGDAVEVKAIVTVTGGELVTEALLTTADSKAELK